MARSTLPYALRTAFLFATVGLVMLCASSAFAQVYVNPYLRQDGTYVPGHYRSAPDGNPYNNWSSQGNVNPYTYEKGYRNPTPSYSSPSYGRDPFATPSYGTKKCQNWPC